MSRVVRKEKNAEDHAHSCDEEDVRKYALEEDVPRVMRESGRDSVEAREENEKN